ncbi:Smr domain-containing protein [Plasmodiophora brassicae]
MIYPMLATDEGDAIVDRIVAGQDQRVLHLPYRLPLSFLRRMSAALPLNFSLCRLVLSGCSIDDVGGRMVAKALRENKALRDVDLGRNVLGDRTAVDLANALSVNDVLVRLDLRCNPIGDIGAKALCKMLSCNTTLTSLSLYECCIGNRGMAALADALRISSTLQRLDVLDNLNTNRYF